jgi:signal transduction histidine kinase
LTKGAADDQISVNEFALDRLRCEFVLPATEHAFRCHHLAWSQAQLRITLIICGIFYLAFSATDIAVLGYSKEAFILGCIRVTVAALAAVMVVMSSRHPMQLVATGLSATVVEATGMLAFLVIVAYRPTELPWHGMSYGLMLVVVYIFIPNRALLAAGVALASTVLFLALAWRLNVVPANEFVMLTMLLILANTFGLLAARRYHRLWRREFQAQFHLKTTVSQLEVATVEAHRARELAERLADEKSKFLSAASHDLRQPVQAMGLFSEALSRTQLSDDQRQISNYLTRSTQNMSEILEGLLNVARFDSGALRANIEVVDIDAVLHDLVSALSPLGDARGLRLRTVVSLSGLRVMADGSLLTGVLKNLIGNAIKYTEHGGVLVAVRRRGDQALIQVWDTGRGIAPDQLERVFDEYYQIGNPERDAQKGLGLGLAIVRRIARLMATEVIVRSRLGRGSVFEFRLPLTR